MSKTLNRPMFRGGGRVESRGTGIVANLKYNQGGRVGYQAGNLVTGGQLLRQAQEGTQFLPNIRPLSGALYGSDVLFPGGQPPSSMFINPLYQGSTQFGNEPTDMSVGAPMNYVPYSAEEIKTGEVESESDYEPGGEMDVSKIQKKEVEPGTDEEKKTIEIEDSSTVDLEDFERDAAEYAKLLGVEKARGRDISDMLARFSAAALQRPGRGEKRGLTDVLADFMAMEAKTPSRTEAIEQAAAKLAITGKQAKDIALSKAQLKAYTDAYKKYAPAKEVKLYEFLKKKVGDQDALRIALGGEKNFATLLNKRAKDLGLPKLPTDSFKNVVREFYGDSYEGDLPNIDQSKLDGVYTVPGTTRIVIYDKGKLRKDTTY